MKLNKEQLKVFLLCGLCIIGTVGIANSYGLYFDPLSAHLGVGRTKATMHVSIASLVSGFAAPLISKIARKTGLRKIFICGTFLGLLSGITIASARSVVLVDAVSVLKGIGSACLSIVFVSMIVNGWFPDSKGTVLGIVLSSSGISTALLSPLLQRAISSLNFRNAYLISVTITFVTCLLFALFCPIAPEEKDRQKKEAEKENLDRKTGKTKLQYFSFLYLSMVMMAAGATTFINTVSHLPSFALTRGFSAETGALLLSAVMTGNVLFKLLIGMVVDRFDPFIGYSAAMGMAVLGMAVLLLNRESAFLDLAGSCLFGSAYAAAMICVPNLYNTFYSGHEYTDAYSLSSLLCSLYSSAVFTGVNYLYDLLGSYDAAFLAILILNAACIPLSLMLKRKASGKDGTRQEI